MELLSGFYQEHHFSALKQKNAEDDFEARLQNQNMYMNQNPDMNQNMYMNQNPSSDDRFQQ